MKSIVFSLLSLVCFFERAPAADEPLQVELIPRPDTAPIFYTAVRFTNTGRKDVLRIVRPSPISNNGLQPPFYRATLRHPSISGQRGVCGNSSFEARLPEGAKWPEDYVVALGPGESFETVILVPYDLPESGKATLSFEYVMPDRPTSGRGLVFPENLWHGTARARDVPVEARKPVPSRLELERPAPLEFK